MEGEIFEGGEEGLGDNVDNCRIEFTSYDSAAACQSYARLRTKAIRRT